MKTLKVLVAVLVAEAAATAVFMVALVKFPVQTQKAGVIALGLAIGVAAYKVGMWYSNGKESNEPSKSYNRPD